MSIMTGNHSLDMFQVQLLQSTVIVNRIIPTMPKHRNEKSISRQFYIKLHSHPCD